MLARPLLVLLLACIVASAARADCVEHAGYPWPSDGCLHANHPNTDIAAVLSQVPGRLATVPTNRALTAFSGATAVYRQGFAAQGDGGAAHYLYSSAPCTLNSGAGDDGSQVQAPGGACWVADLPLDASPMIWGCAGDGSTDDTTCVQKAVTALQGTGRRLNLGPHMYALSRTITISRPLTIEGGAKGCRYADCSSSPVSSGFYPQSANLTLLSLAGTGASGSKLIDFAMRMEGKAAIFTNTSGAAIQITGQTTDVEVSGLEIWSPCFGIDDRSSNENYYHNNRIVAVYGTSCAGVRIGFSTTGANTVGPRLDQNAITCNPNSDPAQTGRAGILILDAGGAYFTANDILYCLSGTEINPGAGQQVLWSFFTGTVAGDTDHGNDVYINTSASTAQVLGLQFTGSWASNAGAQGLYVGRNGATFYVANDGGGLVRGINLIGQRALAANGTVNSIDLEAGDDITIASSTLCPAQSGGAAAVQVSAASTNVKFIGNRIGQCYQAGSPGTITTGINIATGAGVTQIVGNDFTGATTPIFWQSGRPAGVVVVGNIGVADFTQVTSAVSCPSGVTAGTVQVSNGLVTHC
jgi:hypothetical protein